MTAVPDPSADASRLARIVRYPVKGFPGHPVPDAEVRAGGGIPYDRVLAVRNGQRHVSDGGWATSKAFVRLTTSTELARFTVELDTTADTVRLSHPELPTLTVSLTDPETLARANTVLSGWFPAGPLGPPALVRAGNAFWDEADGAVSLINLGTVAALAEATGAEIDPLRFRGNLYLAGLPAWAELDLIGQRITLGEVELEILHPINRCRATAVNPTTAQVDLNIPAELARRFGHIYCGLRARVVRPGVLRPGDALAVGGHRVRPVRADPGPDPAQWPRPARVERVTPESLTVTSVWLHDPIADVRATVRPGQHVRVHAEDGAGPVWRAYTVSGVDGDQVRISVKRQGPDGRMSGLLGELAVPGRTLRISGPHGRTTLDPTAAGPLLLASAGIGITQTLAMLRACADAQPGRELVFCHTARDGAGLALWSEASALLDRMPNATALLYLTRPAPGELAKYSAESGRPDLAAVAASDTTAYLCGPVDFMRTGAAALVALGVPAARVHREVFASPEAGTGKSVPPPEPGPFRVSFSASGVNARWSPENGTLLDLAESAGLTPPAGCRTGACEMCLQPLSAGSVAYTTEPALTPPTDSVLLCCAVPVGDLTVGC